MAITIDGSNGITQPDNAKLKSGNSDDLQIYHDGVTSIIKETGSGDLRLQGSNIDFKSGAGETVAYFQADGPSILYYNGSDKLTTTSTGVDVTGTASIGSGIIGDIGGDISVVQGSVGVRVNDVASALSPTTATSNNDASVDLGVSNIRFKDLYLSGGAYLGGTAAANKLDDYEEGTWTATLQSGATTTPTNAGASYTKIGNIVTVHVSLFFGSITLNGTNLELSGLPFTPIGRELIPATCYMRCNFNTAKNQFWQVDSGTTVLKLRESTTNTNGLSYVTSQASGTYSPEFDILSFSYKVA